MFAHIQIGAKDLPRLCTFYDRVLVHFGLERLVPLEDVGPAGLVWRMPGRRWPQFVVSMPFDVGEATVGHGTQVSFLASERSAVDAAWRTAISNGGVDQGLPGLRLRYAPDFYAAYCLDPEGHKLCFVHTTER
ncbi:VOC family protein [Variovorax sp. J22G73]|uniref:VOC family protein n=1 Tax=unclassified Variovorax TaxID=663243 RepID=UPI002574FDB4|nr:MULTISPECIES: VOC family protein [unclassified Variovorax]MDM0010584.1 VOC family protein [Variovorax sp. J22R203]MDM0103087.1 VOC family protein [Variovorax sp. J22G73]